METFLTHNALYVVLVVTMITWAGIAITLNRIEQRLQKVEKKIER
ncbi:MAG: CcmD family protein [Candidatus Kapaibacterium sp.]|jgi:hypothetical protein|nr:CcmD family protein [Candidatus Kapabacteria bacterium]